MIDEYQPLTESSKMSVLTLAASNEIPSPFITYTGRATHKKIVVCIFGLSNANHIALLKKQNKKHYKLQIHL